MPASIQFCRASKHNAANDSRWQVEEGEDIAYATGSVLVICGAKAAVKEQLTNGELPSKFKVCHLAYRISKNIVTSRD